MHGLLLCGFLAATAVSAQNPPVPPNIAGLLQVAVEHHWDAENQQDSFTYIERWHNRNFDAQGRLLLDETAKFESVSLEGKPYLRMVERDGKPLSDNDATVEEQHYDSAIASGSGLNMRERVSAIVARNVDFGLDLNLLPKYFDVNLVGSEIVEGHRVIHLDCAPRKDVKPRDKKVARATHFHLQVWIDTREQEFVRVDAEKLDGGHGILPGSTASLTWAPVEGVWLPSRTEFHGKARAKHPIVSFDTEYTFTGYRKFHSDVRIVSVAPAPE